MTHNGVFLSDNRQQQIRDGIRMTAVYRAASEDDALSIELAMSALVRRAALGADLEALTRNAIRESV